MPPDFKVICLSPGAPVLPLHGPSVGGVIVEPSGVVDPPPSVGGVVLVAPPSGDAAGSATVASSPQAVASATTRGASHQIERGPRFTTRSRSRANASTAAR